MKRSILNYLILLFVTLLAGIVVISISKWLEIDPTSLKASRSPLTWTRFGIGIFFSSVIIIAVYVTQRFINLEPFSKLGFKRPVIRNLLAGIIIGIGLATLVRLINVALAQDFIWEWTIPDQIAISELISYYIVFIFIVFLNSFQEELLFRAYPLELFKRHPHALIYIVFATSLIFAVLHNMTDTFNLYSLLTRFLMGVFLSLLYLQSGSIWKVIGVHSGLNWTVWSMTGNWEMGGFTKLTINSTYNGQLTNVIVLVIIIIIFWLLKKNEIVQLSTRL